MTSQKAGFMPNATSNGKKVLISVLLGTFTVSLNNSALNLAVAELMVTFNASATQVSWVVFLAEAGRRVLRLAPFLDHPP